MHALRDLQPGRCCHFLLRGNRAEFFPAQFGIIPDPVAELDEFIRLFIHCAGNKLSCTHRRLPLSSGTAESIICLGS